MIFGGYVYDGLMLVVDVIKWVGIIDKVKVCDVFEVIKGFVGISGIFNMLVIDYMGFDFLVFCMFEVKNGVWIIV